MDKLKVSIANLVILIAGAVIFIASFLAFTTFHGASVNAWSNGRFLIATLPALLGAVMATQVALTAYAPSVKLPGQVLGFTWNQVHLVLAGQATIMMIAFVIQDTSPFSKGFGLYLMLLSAIALLIGAVMRIQDTSGRHSNFG